MWRGREEPSTPALNKDLTSVALFILVSLRLKSKFYTGSKLLFAYGETMRAPRYIQSSELGK